MHVGVASVDPQHIHEVLNIVRDTSEYVLCPGLKPSVYEFHRQGIRIFDYPTKRYESTGCLLWHKPTNSRSCSEQCVFHANKKHTG